AEQLLRNGLSEHAYSRRALDVGVGVHAATDDVPVLQRKVFRADSAHGCRPVLIAVHHLDARIRLRRDVRDEVDVLPDRLVIGDGERARAERSGSHTAAVHTAGLDPDHVGADVRDGALDIGGRAFADGDNADDRSDADYDAEHRQARAHRVLTQSFERDPQNDEDVHRRLSGLIEGYFTGRGRHA